MLVKKVAGVASASRRWRCRGFVAVIIAVIVPVLNGDGLRAVISDGGATIEIANGQVAIAGNGKEPAE